MMKMIEESSTRRKEHICQNEQLSISSYP